MGWDWKTKRELSSHLESWQPGLHIGRNFSHFTVQKVGSLGDPQKLSRVLAEDSLVLRMFGASEELKQTTDQVTCRACWSSTDLRSMLRSGNKYHFLPSLLYFYRKRPAHKGLKTQVTHHQGSKQSIEDLQVTQILGLLFGDFEITDRNAKESGGPSSWHMWRDEEFWQRHGNYFLKKNQTEMLKIKNMRN